MTDPRAAGMRPLAYLRDRPVPVLALAMAFSRVMARYRRRVAEPKPRVELQPKLWVEKEGTK